MVTRAACSTMSTWKKYDFSLWTTIRPIADLVATVARYEGWEAVTAYSGEEALARPPSSVPTSWCST